MEKVGTDWRTQTRLMGLPYMLVLGVNVGTYGSHGVSGEWKRRLHQLPSEPLPRHTVRVRRSRAGTGGYKQLGDGKEKSLFEEDARAAPRA